jgi:hypothetical protein
MSVFLRWGVFGILGVAALLYAYNASKRLAENRTAQASTPAAAEPTPVPDVARPEALPARAIEAPRASPRCEVELEIARRALEARRQGEPLDRLLRIQEIAFEGAERRARLEEVATAWYRFEGAEPAAEALRIAVVSDCVRAGPGPAP